MNDFQWMLLGGIIVTVVLGTSFFLLAGTYHVKKNQVIIMEKLGQFYRAYDHGTHFLMPTVYRCMAKYSTLPLVKAVQITDGPKLDLTYQITDPVKFHYSGFTVDSYLNKVRKENSPLTQAVLITEFGKIGVKYISLARSKAD